MKKRIYLILGCALCGLASGSPEDLKNARTTIGEWAAAEKAISRERIDWEEEGVLLRDLIAVAEQRVEKLEAAVAASEEFVSTADEQRMKLLDRKESIGEKVETVETFLAGMEAQLRRLKPRLPEPLQAELEPLYRRLPKADQERLPGMGERMQSVVGLLTKIRQFDTKISVSESIRTLPGREVEASFRTLWVGLGQAYYLAPEDAGYGVAGEDGWVWHSEPALAPRLRETIALVEGTRGEPKLFDLPVELWEGGTQ